ncbi:Transmembrane protein [Trema orientale]|uniref:Transmembrane protein n=1 Tax=Trema orientale TaxID=63057 RepID=A0A2P5ECE3_TREOI|nr:Transmembrane protein [Trema orientale]
MSALHIAAENGRNYVVSILVQICPDCCELQDNRGWTALHVAVEAGHLNVVTNLLHKKPFNYLINEKDDQGNTVLHLAAIHGRYLILRRLASDKRLDKGAINKDGMTVVDIIQTSTELYHDKKLSLTTMLKERGLQPSLERRFVLREKRTDEQTDNKELKENEIIQETDDQETSKQLAKNKRVVGAAAASHGASSSSMTSNEKRKEKGLEIKRKKKYYGWSPELVKNFANVNLLVATIIASITFAAAMTMPGGYDSTAGMAVLRTKSSFKLFLIFDSLAFSCSSASMCIHFLVAFTARFNIDKYSYSISAVVLLTLLSIVSTVISFIMGTDAVLSYRKGGHGLSAKVAIISFTVPVSYFFLRLVVVLFKRLHLYIGNRK